MTITNDHRTQLGILLGVQLEYMIQRFLFSCYKGILKCKLLNSPLWN